MINGSALYICSFNKYILTECLLCARYYVGSLYYSNKKHQAQIFWENFTALFPWVLSDNKDCLLIGNLL